MREISLAPQVGHRMPSGQRVASRCSRQASSVLNSRFTSMRFIGMRPFQLRQYHLRMAQSVLCYEFHCPKYRASIKRRHDDLEQRCLGLAPRPTGIFPVALVCIVCSRIDIYSPDPSSLQFDPSVRTRSLPLPVAHQDWLHTLTCVGGSEEFQVPILSIKTGKTTERERFERAKEWTGEHLRCPAGRSFLWPVT